MARHIDPVCRLCRRELTKLFLKGERCFSEKCAVEKRNYPPGQHGKARPKKMQGYGIQLREKQKTKRYYGLLEKQFRLTFQKAERKKGITGENLLQALEQRLDNVVYRLGFAPSRPCARQLVSHGHFQVNGRKVDIPSFTVKVGANITLKEGSRQNAAINRALELAQSRGIPEWLELDAAGFQGKVLADPKREEIKMPLHEQLVVELYSK